jgi:AraC family transcriptional regulator
MAALIIQMGEEARNGCPSGRLHGQSICLALAAYIHGRYSPQALNQGPSKARLSSARVRRIQDFVHAHLSEDLSLGDLAAVVQLSPSHFSELFKNTCGSTPYQYVLRERVAEARRLLSTGHLSVIEVAHAVGYQDQSHFTTIFRKFTQTTPKQFQLDSAVVSRRASS